ncbi:hypothetical protein NCC49_003969 [Naganishia albida]|nr:hypothetical protein NCC49_003969 [Naganishia albida]
MIHSQPFSHCWRCFSSRYTALETQALSGQAVINHPDMSSSTQPEVVLPTNEAQAARASTLAAEGKKALALGEWEVAVEKYADALELMRALHGELATELAPLLLPYGKALFEVACKQTGVLGKADEGAEEPAEKAPVGKAAQFSFEGDGDDDEEQQDEGEGEGQAEGEGDDDDFTVAWEVLDLARTLFEKQGTAAAARDLGETYATLGDVSLETENFPQAVEDYTSALQTFHQCLPLTSREVASSHYKLAIVLESLSDRKQEAIENVEKAIESVQARKAAIGRGQDPDHLEDSHDVGGHNLRAHSKGKGRAMANENYMSSDLTVEERKKQVDDCEEQLRDLQAKLEDLKTAPESQGIVEDTIAHLLGNTADASGTAGQAITDAAGKVNDLTSMVKKKARKTADKVVPRSADAVKEQVSAVQEQVTGQASTLQEQAIGQASAVRDQVAGQASAVADQVVDQASALKEQALDQASTLRDQVIDQASTTAESLREKLVDGAHVAADTLKDKAEGVLAQAQHTVDDLMKKGTTQAAHAIDAIKAAANSVVQEIMDEGKEITQESVEAIQGVIEDVQHGGETVVHVAEDLAHTAQQTASAGLESAKHAGEAVMQEIMEEGQEVTREAVEDVVETAEDVLGSVEAIGREGKRKVEELRPEEVDEVSKKPRTE